MRIVLYALLLTVLVLTAWASFSQPGAPRPSQPADPAGELMAWGAVVVILAGVGVVYWRWRRQGDEARAAAAARGLSYTRTLASDLREPFTRLPTVSRGVLLHNVLEGQWHNREVAVFDMRPHRKSADQWTYALLPLPGGWPEVRARTVPHGQGAADRTLSALFSTWETIALPAAWGGSATIMTDAPEAAARVIGPETARLVAAARQWRIEIDAEHLLYTEMEKVAAADVSAFLDRVAVLVDALVADRARRAL